MHDQAKHPSQESRRAAAAATAQSPQSDLVQPIAAGALAAVVGFASAFTIVLQGLAGVGATPEQAASGLLVLCVGQGILAITFGLISRKPISFAWSTPGAALLMGAGVPQGGFGVAVAAFLLTGLLIVIAGIWRPLGRAVSAIPLPLANAMLAGVLLELCLAPFRAIAAAPLLALPIVLAWALGWTFARRFAVPIAVAMTGLIVALATPIPAEAWAHLWPEPVFVMPVWDFVPVFGLAIPLFIVTMASQNVPGLAVLRSNGYEIAVRPVFIATGIASWAVALFGGHGLNLSAITAALCAGPEAGANPARRYIASVTTGLVYIPIGLGVGFAAAFIAASPPLLIQAVAGLALLTSLAAALAGALSRETGRLPALVTFVTTASGISIFGIGAAFWGLVAGGLMLMLERREHGAA
ncbi:MULTISPECIES: benzoate/H(+) symporter BenE family transporter [unclassified Chelatococcus]|uniref:benzoate/H(+) symporter BenE family transporter n=1 Tax=unclassified Chelatococcus TaxID=2638111 RepID=UPI001BCEF527|nr:MULTISPECIES: benzoate/H(+) symporter BenE family transporter [unclassified Chelatococcus]CAH1673053.1 Benzoate transport protein [Hyphomicrobiales bacterium]MBS7738873.1 benzoate/H(+) symporter BenE family transporter [Chelatococcus sp. HY11]MBX3547025.1 benzoate/H(+) symporter BenE family transporter [Chelatococcus sp.]MCO5076599.1 benzoate/H(+) symporter BenE family transporter [Chelatococcus sp.]CAH1674709.1 Benzoate transport protein [Hyphomicrobiales bacterium]